MKGARSGFVKYKYDKQGNINGAEAVGIDGLTGYLKFLAIHEPKSFAVLLGRVMPMQLNVQGESVMKDIEYKTVEEVLEELRQRGIPIDKIFN